MLRVIPLDLSPLCRDCALTLENFLSLILLLFLSVLLFLIFFLFCNQKSLYVIYNTFVIQKISVLITVEYFLSETK